MRKVESILRRVLEEQRADPRRVIWAVGRVVEDVYREVEARGRLVDDRLEDGLAAVQRFCLDPESMGTQEIRDQYHGQLLDDWRAIMRMPDPTGRDTKLWIVIAAVRMLVHVAADVASGYAIRAIQREIIESLEYVRSAWEFRLGEPTAAAEDRVLFTLKGALAEEEPR